MRAGAASKRIARPKRTAARKNDPARAREILKRLEKAYPDAKCALKHTNPFQLLVATILSAQCTDERVNKVTPALFRAWPDAAALGRAPLPALEAAIRSTGFFRA
ncbi:MAG: hypothetical protein HY651_13025 [Acidobacteria bacterium]|nr:hypothetical protein [Acidobacteriota bacterium]